MTILLLCIMAFSLCALNVLAAYNGTKPTLTEEQETQIEAANNKTMAALNANFDAYQEALLKALDAVILKLDKLEDQITSNEFIDDETQRSAQESISDITSALTDYRAQIEDATTAEEIQAINKEMIQYIKDHKDEILATVSQATYSMAYYTLDAAQVYIAYANSVLEIYEKTCDEYEDDIQAIEDKLAELQVSIEEMQDTLETNGPVTEEDMANIHAQIEALEPLTEEELAELKATIKETTAQMQEAQAMMQEVYNECVA